MSVAPALAIGGGIISAFGDIRSAKAEDIQSRVAAARDRVGQVQRDSLSLQSAARAEARVLISDKVAFEQQRAGFEAQERASRLNGEFTTYEADGRRVAADRTAVLGEIEVEDIRNENERGLAEQVADLAGAGRDISSGTSLVLAYSSAREGERDVLKSRTGTMLEVEALREEGKALDVQSALHTGEADFAGSQSKFAGEQGKRKDADIAKLTKDLTAGIASLDAGATKDLKRLRKKGDMTGAYISAGAKLLGGASKIASLM